MIKIYSKEFFDDILNLEKKSFSEAWSEKMLKGEIENENSLIFVYEKDEKIVGYILVNVCFDETEIYRICVDFDYRRCKIATKMIEYVKSNIKNAVKINLEVKESNVSAISLYKKCGFEVVGMRKKYYKDNENAVLMTCVNLSD